MSFANNVKHELCKIEIEDVVVARGILAGIIFFGGQSQNKNEIIVTTENAQVSKLCWQLAKEILGESPECNIKARGKAHIYAITLKNCEEFAKEIGFAGFARKISPQFLDNSEIRIAFLRGAFLASGYMSNPEKSYHMEILTRYSALQRNFAKLLEDMGLRARVIRRNGMFVFYFKGSQEITDFLTLIGAMSAMLEFTNIKIMKELKGNVNRIVNCETANVEKMVRAAQAQIKAITEYGIDNLPSNLQAAARMRVDNPECSLKEIGEMLEPQLSKSGVNHVMRKIMGIANG
ncbi:MAG: DNA-binding protein WhiA [Clostridiales bacterium]|jgi:DNA-binding protein WhiA|nr:DNA-binding protein WhiA [Clostridiales bacterium]